MICKWLPRVYTYGTPLPSRSCTPAYGGEEDVHYFETQTRIPAGDKTPAVTLPGIREGEEVWVGNRYRTAGRGRNWNGEKVENVSRTPTTDRPRLVYIYIYVWVLIKLNLICMTLCCNLYTSLCVMFSVVVLFLRASYKNNKS